MTSGRIVVALALFAAAPRIDACELRVLIVDSTNSPLPGARVTVRLAGTARPPEARYSGEDGLVVFHGLPAATKLNVSAEFLGALPAQAAGACEEGAPPLKLVLAEPVAVPMAALLANPEKFAGQYVQTEGYLTLGFEQNRLFASEEDFVKHRELNSLALDPPQWLLDDRRLNKRHVYIRAVFGVTDCTGRLGSIQACGRTDR